MKNHSGKSEKNTPKDLWIVFWNACKETPRGMFAPFLAFWECAVNNPVLSKSPKKR